MAVSAPYTRSQLGVIFGSALLGYAMDGYNMLIVSFVLPDIERGLDMSATAAGSVISVQLVASIMGGMLFGRIADRWGRKNGLLLSIVLYSVGALASGFSWNLSSLLALRFVTGIGLGGEWGLGMTLMRETWSSKRRGLGSGIIQSSFIVGIAIAGTAATVITQALGPGSWRVVLMTGAVPVLLGLAMRLWLPESRDWQRDRDRRAAGTDGAGFTDAGVLGSGGLTRRPWVNGALAALLVGGYMLAFYAVATFMPSLITHGYHAGGAVAKSISDAVIWIAVPFYIGAGALSDLLGRKKALLIPGALMIAASVFLYVATAADAPYPGSLWGWPVFWAYCLWYIGTGAGSVFGVWFAEIFPIRIRASASSMSYMFGRGASAASPVIVPALAGAALVAAAHPLGPAMALLSIIGAAVVLLAGVALPETHRRHEGRAVASPAVRVAAAQSASTDGEYRLSNSSGI